jgi:hypothetical protein
MNRTRIMLATLGVAGVIGGGGAAIANATTPSTTTTTPSGNCPGM